MIMKLRYYIQCFLKQNLMLVLKSYDRETKWMSFLIEDDDLLRNFNTIWDKVKADIRKEFDWDPVCNQKSFDN